MSSKNKDFQKRYRSLTVGFRMSPEEHEVLKAKIKMSGLSKQDYLTQNVINPNINVHGSPVVSKQIMKYLELFIERFNEIETLDELNFDEVDVLDYMLSLIRALRNKKMTQIKAEKETPTK